ncbi:MAG: sel1 repeat family protein [Hyphomicrobiaceae bacterium]|nr:sel1 repeat family protein [Hyphomicrobiaceae bacterium]
MARFELPEAELSTMGAQVSADVYYRLGLMYATGRSVEPNLVSAHKWLNLAAHQGNRDAISLRAELAREMKAAEVAEALRQAREWLKLH